MKIPKLRTGSFFPSLLERRRRIDRALFAVVMEAYVHGVSTRKVDDLVDALGGTGDLQVRGVPDLRRARRRPRRVPEPAAGRVAVPVRVPRRHLLQGPGQRPGRVPGGRHRHRRHGRRRPRSARLSPSATARPRRSGPTFLRPARPRPARGAAGDLRRPHRAQGGDRRGAAAARPGSAAGSTSCATCWPRSPRPTPTWSPPRSAPIFAQPDAGHVRAQLDRGRRRCSPASSPTVAGHARATPTTTCSRSPASPRRTGARSGRPTRSSGSTGRSSGAPTSSGSSPTRRRCSGSSPRPGRGPRRMARRRTPLPLRRLHGPALPHPHPRPTNPPARRCATPELTTA